MRAAAISVAGLALFLWPFVASSTPPGAAAVALSVGVVLVLVFIEASTRKLDARRFALLAAIAAIDAGLRLVLVTGLGGFSPVFFLILAAGYVYGPSYGFLCGSVALLASALATGGIGPWLPYEMVGCGFVGLVAGFAGFRRTGRVTWRDIAVLAAVGAFTGFAYGALLDVWDWTAFYRGVPNFGWEPGLTLTASLGRFGRFYLATSLVYDSVRAAGNALAVVVLGAPVLAGLVRMRSRFDVVVVRSATEPTGRVREPAAGSLSPS
jgi:energy-coupling factor transport system substrate-specific component